MRVKCSHGDGGDQLSDCSFSVRPSASLPEMSLSSQTSWLSCPLLHVMPNCCGPCRFSEAAPPSSHGKLLMKRFLLVPPLVTPRTLWMNPPALPLCTLYILVLRVWVSPPLDWEDGSMTEAWCDLSWVPTT